MAQYGPVVPIVRCLSMHSTNLNLSFAGEIYESPLYWENERPSRVDLSPFFNAPKALSPPPAC